jgi:hypothetical protein
MIIMKHHPGENQVLQDEFLPLRAVPMLNAQRHANGNSTRGALPNSPSAASPASERHPVLPWQGQYQ